MRRIGLDAAANPVFAGRRVPEVLDGGDGSTGCDSKEERFARSGRGRGGISEFRAGHADAGTAVVAVQFGLRARPDEREILRFA